MTNYFKFQLGQAVRMAVSEEAGNVEARAEYLNSENQYYILYKAADGRQVTAWWGESQIGALEGIQAKAVDFSDDDGIPF